ncbi:MAG: glutathione synthase [Pseudomonadota bacterium]
MRLGVVMDPISSITPYKDSTLAMLLAASRRGWAITYYELGDLTLDAGVAYGHGRPLEVRDDNDDWYTLGESTFGPLSNLDVLLMRKDPPFDMEFVYATYILQRAEDAGVKVVNRPSSLRDMNEKAYTAWFPELCPPTLIARKIEEFRAFAAKFGKIVVKPLDGMGGKSIFVVNEGDPNASVVYETLTDDGQRFAMAQGFLPEITDGDKRVLLINGEPVSHMLARVPAKGESRGNLAKGATGEGRPLGDAERAISALVGPVLKEKGVIFAGLDVIGSRLTEINVTSPTGIRELENEFGLDIAGNLMAVIEKQLT